jgi:hypothetical protein
MGHFEPGQTVWISEKAPHHAGQLALFQGYAEHQPTLAIVTVLEQNRKARAFLWQERYIEARYLTEATGPDSP